MKKPIQNKAQMFKVTLSVKDAYIILAVLEREADRLQQLQESEGLLDCEHSDLVHSRIRLNRFCQRLSRAVVRNAGIGSEPEFIKAVQDAIDNGTL